MVQGSTHYAQDLTTVGALLTGLGSISTSTAAFDLPNISHVSMSNDQADRCPPNM